MRFLVKAFVPGALAIALIVGCGQKAQDISYTTSSAVARDYFNQGLEKYDELMTSDARALFRKATEADSNFAMAYYYLALASPNADEYRINLRRAMALSDKVSEPERLAILALQAQSDDQLDLAQEYYEKLAALFPEGVRANYMLGTFYFVQQKWSLAEAQLKKVIALDADFAPAYNLLAYSYSSQDKYIEAIEALKKYAALRPRDANPHDSMGEMYLYLGNYEKSITEYDEALKLDPGFIFSIVGIGHNYVFLEQYDKAREEYAKILPAAKSWADTSTVYFWTALSFIYEGEYNKAIEEFNTQLEFAKSHDDLNLQAQIYGQLAMVYYEQGDYVKALEESAMERNIADNPILLPSTKAGFLRNCDFTEALVYAKQGKIETARDLVDMFTQSAEDSKSFIEDKNMHGLEGMVAYLDNDFNLAVEELELSNDQNPYMMYYLALSYEKIGLKEKAEEEFGKIVNFNRNSFEYAFVRAKAVAKL